ncbi:MAG TPA: hypothetical protein VFA43_21355 [Gemmatimonadaceae bacterium]|nr:hypothetical protein [Gemmatimonadaceae bacterium]
MRRFLVLPLGLAIACSSSTSPQHEPLTGAWRATSATLPAGLRDFRVTLTQVNDTITGTAVLDYIGDRSVTFKVAGRAGLNGGECGTIDVVIPNCHVQFQFTATANEATDEFINFGGGLVAGGQLRGDVGSTADFPFTSIDGRELGFERATTPN